MNEPQGERKGFVTKTVGKERAREEAFDRGGMAGVDRYENETYE
jgi:hypothetical protein